MLRSFYSFTFTFALVIGVMKVVEALVYAQLGMLMVYMEKYPNWLLSATILSAIEAVVMLKYFRIRHYKAAFGTGLIYYFFAIGFLFLNYGMLKFAPNSAYYVPMQAIMFVFQIIFSFTLLLSLPRERFWLRVAGGYLALLTIIALTLFSMVISGQFIEYHPVIEGYHGPILYAGAIIPFLTAMNFYYEWQGQPDNDKPDNAFTYSTPLLVIIGLLIVVPFGLDSLNMDSPAINTAMKRVAEPFEARSYVNAGGDTLRYRLLKPLDYNESERYPIITCLHGSGGTGSDNYKQVATSLLPEFMTNEPNRKKYQAFIFVPQCPFGTSWGGIHPLPAFDQIVFEAMASLEKEFPIDTNRRYVGGVSLGGYGTWHFIATHPEIFAAAIPICGAGDPSLASNCVDVPVWAFHGAHDERVNVSGSRNMIKALQAAGGDPRYTEFPDAGHNIGRLVCDTPGLLDWLFAQKRDTTRTTFQ